MKILTLTLLFLYGSMSVIAQQTGKEKEKINFTILELFDAYRHGDSARVAAVFTKEAVIQTVHKDKEGKVVLSTPIPASKLINYIGSGLSEVHDERLWDTQIFYDEFMATVWTRYAFYLGKKFMHCGTEVFNLRKVNGDWKIFYLADTRQLENCNVPPSVK
jgi:hypothetical protein